jgi:hypothetical protein
MILDDTLQPDDELSTEQPLVEVEEVQESSAEGVEKPAAQAPAEEGKKVQFNEEQQRLIDRKMGEQVAKRRKAERDLDDLRKRLEALEAPRAASIVVPELPDPYSVSGTEFNKAKLERDEALRKSVIAEQHNENLRQQQERLRHDREELEQKALQERGKLYDQRAKALGISDKDLLEAGTSLAEFGIGEKLAGVILKDEEGPLLTKYLSQNKQDLYELVNLPLEDAIVKLLTQVKRDAAI